MGEWEKLSSFFKEQSVDIVIASHVIEHTANDLLCINEIYKVLKKGGILLFNTPNRKRLTRSIVEIFTGERKFPYWEHQREYIKGDLLKLIKQSNFEITKAAINGIALGLCGGRIFFYIKKVPVFLEKFSNYWQVQVVK